MARERSAAVTIIAILHLIGGGLGLITTFCAGGWLVLVTTIPAGPNRAGRTPEPPEIHAYLRANAPGYLGFQFGTMLLGLAFAVLLLAAGVGLLNRQAWARWATIVWAALSILVKLLSALYLFLVIHPAMTAQMAISGRVRPDDQAGDVIGMMMLFFVDPCSGLPFVIYPIAALIVMLLPGVAASFDHADDRRGRDDEDDEDRGRRRWEDEDDEDDDSGRRRGRDRWRD